MKTEKVQLNREELSAIITGLNLLNRRDDKTFASANLPRLYNRLYTTWEELVTLENILGPAAADVG